MKRVTFSEITHFIFIENRHDIEDKETLWWTEADFISFRSQYYMEKLLLFTLYN